MVKTILRVTPIKRPEVQEILNLPYFNLNEASEVKSLANTEDSQKTKGSLQFLNESCNPKKIAELQKILFR